MDEVVEQLPLSSRTFHFPPPHPSLTLAYKNCYIIRSGANACDYTGLRIWPGAHLLLRYLLHSHPHLASLTLCELGSGIGLCGLACAPFASRVLLTDRVPAVLGLLQHNAALNHLHSSVSVHSLEWGHAQAQALLDALSPPRTVHCVLAADVVYPDTSSAVMHHLLDAVECLLRPAGPSSLTASPLHGTFVLAYVQRSAATSRRLFDAVWERGFHCECVETETFVREGEGEGGGDEARTLADEMQGLVGYVFILRRERSEEWRSMEPVASLCAEAEAETVTSAEEDEASALPLTFEVE